MRLVGEVVRHRQNSEGLFSKTDEFVEVYARLSSTNADAVCDVICSSLEKIQRGITAWQPSS